MYLNTTICHFNTSTIHHCTFWSSILLNTANTTYVQYYQNLNTTRIGPARTGPVRLGPAQSGPTRTAQSWPARPVRRAPNPGWGDGGGGGGSFFGDAARARSAPEARSRRGAVAPWDGV